MATNIQLAKPMRTRGLLRSGGLGWPLVLLCVSSVVVTSTGPAAAAPKGDLCKQESSYIDSHFGSFWANAETAIHTAMECQRGNAPGAPPVVDFSIELAFGGDLPGPLSSESVLSAEAVWQAAHTPGGNEKVWILPQFGRLAPDGSSALGEIPGHGKVTAIMWRSGIPKASAGQPNDFGFNIEIADGYGLVYAITSEWPYPVGRAGVDTYPQAHENALKSLAVHLLPLFYDRTKSKYSVCNLSRT
jgi:hypothetical protein